MQGPRFDAFGRLLIDPGQLDLPGRVDALRRLSGSLQASSNRENQWLGRVLLQWLQHGGDLAEILGVRPPKGSHATAQSVVLQARRDQVLMRLATALGSDAQAIRVLRGQIPCPPAFGDLVRDAHSLECPCSRSAFARARWRASHHRE